MSDSVKKNAFLDYLEHSLLPTLEPNSILVLDNWRVHHGDDVRDLVEAAGCTLLYLPTYSPDLNPIEQLFAKVKTFVKQLRPENAQDLIRAFCDALKTISFDNILNAILHCGYGLEE